MVLVTEKTFKVPAEKLGIIFPWYACAFECEGEGDAYGGCPTTPKAASSPKGMMPTVRCLRLSCGLRARVSLA